MIKHIHIWLLLIMGYIPVYSQTLSVTFSKTETMCELGKAEITVISGATPITITWSTGELTNSINQLKPGDYSIEIKDNAMHDTIINFKIEELICEPTPGNHFTPNADGYNDSWSIGRLDYFPDFELFVYNRWGQLVHQQANQYIPWDGKSLSLPTPDGTYYYILYFSKSNKKKFIKGDITILR